MTAAPSPIRSERNHKCSRSGSHWRPDLFSGQPQPNTLMNKEIKFTTSDAEKALGAPTNIEELSENEALRLIQSLIADSTDINIEDIKLEGYEESCPNSWYGLANANRWSLDWDEDEESGTIELSAIDEEEQTQEILEILAGLSRPMPDLIAFFYAMKQKIEEEELAFGDAWNWVTGADGEHSLSKPLGNAIADFRDDELRSRLGYDPDSDSLDEALEHWITYHDWPEGEEYLQYWSINGSWPSIEIEE